MKTLLKLVVLLFCVTTFAQEQKVDYKKIDNDLTKATYYFTDNDNAVEREGFFNKNGKLHGTWISYNEEGAKTVIANYKNGVKEGTWTYIKKEKINLVTYKNNKIVGVETKDVIVN